MRASATLKAGLAACLGVALGAALGPAPACAGERGPLPAYFSGVWAEVTQRPLRTLAPAPIAAPAVSRAIGPAPLAPGAAAADLMAGLPAVMLADIPLPPSRPALLPGAAAYAALAPDAAPAMPDAPQPLIPMPVPRPLLPDAAPDTGLAPHPVLTPAPPKIAMLGGLPGAGAAIGALARMSALPAITNGACSVSEPYKVEALGPGGRTALAPAATLDRPMVDSLVRWEAGMQAAARTYLGEPVAVLRVAASYDCRTMNHRSRARLSEHAHANAIDIASYITASGREIAVRRDFYDKGRDGDFLRAVHAETCSVFQVVLGPGSDGMHEDHFHMDLGRWKACR